MDILNFIISITQYKLSSDKKSHAKKIKQQVETFNPIWKKFAQILSNRTDLISTELAEQLSEFTNRAPMHSDEYSNEILQKYYPEYKLGKCIGSGTIGQVHQVFPNDDRFSDYKNICIKILHPNVKKDIDDAYDTYKKISNNILFPSFVKIFGDEFFENMKRQTNFENEFINSKIMKGYYEGELYKMVDIIDFRKECLIMEEINGEIIHNKDTKYFLNMIMFLILGLYKGMIHGDIHYGNFLIMNKIIYIFDFGITIDVSMINLDERKEWVKAFLYEDSKKILNLLLNNNPKKKYYISRLEPRLGKNKLGEEIQYILLYFQRHNIPINNTVASFLAAFIHCDGLEKEIIKKDINMYNNRKNIKQAFSEILIEKEFDIFRNEFI